MKTRISIALIAFASLQVMFPAFFSFGNISSVLTSAAVMIPAVVGCQYLLLTGRFDLSLGSGAALSVIVGGWAYLSTNSVAIFIGATFATGLICGTTNWFLTAQLRIQPLIATIATMAIFRSLALVGCGGRVMAGLPDLEELTRLSTSANPYAFFIVAIVYSAISVLLLRSIYPVSCLYAIGSNERAAKRAGVPVSGVIWIAFAAAGLGGALTGLMQSVRTSAASPLIFQSLALEAIAACVIGGASLRGARGSVAGAVLGAIAVVAIRNLVAIAGISVYWKDAALGITLITTVLIHGEIHSNTLTKAHHGS